MIPLSIDSELKQHFPQLQVACFCCQLSCKPSSNKLLEHIKQQTNQLQQSIQLPEIAQLNPILTGRRAYRILGKDPARYRLSADALLRRVLKSKGLYSINNVVDTLNLISIQTAWSIGGYDLDKIKGPIRFGVGQKDEAYRGLGRGALNIQYLPVFRDEIGAFGSITSDSERTKIDADTQRFLMLIPSFETTAKLKECLDIVPGIYREYCQAKAVEIQMI